MPRFKLLHGKHVERVRKLGEDGKPIPILNVVGQPIPGQFVMENKSFAKNTAVDSDRNLVELFGENKFQALSSGRPLASDPSPAGGPLPLRFRREQEAKASEQNDGLDEMTVAQLREKAAADEVDLAGVKDKAGIVEALRASTVH